MKEVIIESACGKIRGLESHDGVQKFYGIRYAAAGRWEYPVEVKKWDGIYDATSFKDASVQRRTFYPEQADSFYYNEFRKDETYTYSEDCLFLNIWKPEKCKNAPVILYIHGGAFQGGCGNEKHFDGSSYAKKGVIFITFNYRLGPLGYCALPELQKRDGHTGNYGMYDQFTALKWVYNNIEAFGGSPANITLMGQSAGAMSAQQLCMSPIAQKYISKAIMTSGGGISDSFGNAVCVEDTFPFWKSVMEKVGRNLEEWVSCDLKDLFDAVFATMEQYPNAIQNCSPVIDGNMILYNTNEMHFNKMQAAIPYLMGSTKDDMLPEELKRMAKDWVVLQTEQDMIPSYCFYFSRNLPGDDRGAWHSSELWYTIGALDRCWRPMEEWDYKVSQVLTSYFSNFARTGNPNGDNLPTWNPTCSECDNILIVSDTDIYMGK